MSKIELNFKLDGTLVKYLTITLLSLTGIGILFAILGITQNPATFIIFDNVNDAIGGGIVMASCFGGIGMAFFRRRREQIKARK